MVKLLAPLDTSRQPSQFQYQEEDNPRPAFMDELRSYGFTSRGKDLPSLPEMGRVVRIDAPDDKRGDRSGWYWYTEVSDDHKSGAWIGIGVFGSWRGNPDRVVWTSRRRETMSPSESARMQEQIDAQRIALAQAIADRQESAATEARRIWEASAPVPPDHPYLANKGVQAHGCRVDGGKVVVPVMDGDTIVSLQFVSMLGEKRFLPDGKVKGCFYPIGDKAGDTVYVAEGFATAATIHEATGDMAYVAYNAGNLLEVVSRAKDRHPGASIVICGDDDRWTTGNPGRAKANAAADVMRCRVVFPEFSEASLAEKPTDFNDMDRLEGEEAVREVLNAKPTLYQGDGSYSAMPEPLLNPPGILGDIAAYYNATARAPQPGFAVQTALAVASIILGRNFRTTKGNFTSLYFLNVAKSGTGKEHAKTVIEDILTAADQDGLLNGAGYTSAGAVFSTLLRRPKHITIIDEFGRYLEASKGGKNANLLEANTQLMEAIGRCHGVMRPTAYSTMTLAKDKQEELAGRKIVNPAITLVCMTTPVALFRNLTSDNVADGFLGRFVIHHSETERAVHDDKDLIDVPHRIVDWIKNVIERSGQHIGANNIACDPPNLITIPFTGEALAVLRRLDEYRVKLCNTLEKQGMEALPGRTHEMGMRLALIVALADNPNVSAISEAHAQWAADYVQFAIDQTITTVKRHVAGSEHEGHKKEILQAIRDAGEAGVKWKVMQKMPPYSKHKRKDLIEIVGALMDAELIQLTRISSGGPGRPSDAYVAIEG